MTIEDDPDFGRHAGSNKDHATPESVAATSSLVWGVVAMFAWLLPPVGLLVALAGLVRGYRGWNAPNADRARVGVVLSIFALLMVAWLTTWIIVVSTSFNGDF
jgi:hypothetical protein